jgi:seryl-tRNA synthetase
MLDPKLIRENPDAVKAACRDKRSSVDVDQVLRLDQERRDLQTALDDKKRQRNEASAARDVEKGRGLKEEINGLEAKLAVVEGELQPLLLALPNLPSADTPVGKDDSENVELRRWGTPPTFAFPTKDHVELGKSLGFIDGEKAGQVTGSRFTYLFGDLALLQQALTAWTFKVLTDRATLEHIIKEAGLSVPATPFVPVVPPLMINPATYQRMARLEPREERYHIPSDDLYLIGSAEHTLGPIHMDETLKEAELPRRYVACTAAFRREAGSYGKDVQGIIRQHQFDKVEMESFCLPELSIAEQDFFVAIQEYLLRQLGLAHRVVITCTGDMGDPDARHLDVETWMPGQNTYRETHSADLMTDYQARRLNTKVKRADGTNQFVHMNDATAIAMGRTMVAIMENYQQADGSVRVPEVLMPYLHGKAVMEARS